MAGLHAIAAPARCYLDRCLVQDTCVQCKVAIQQQYTHAEQTGGFATLCIYVVPAAMCPTNICYLPLPLQVQERGVQPMLCGLGRNVSSYRYLAQQCLDAAKKLPGLQAPMHASCSLVSLCDCKPTDATLGTTQHASDIPVTRTCYTNAHTMNPIYSFAFTVCQLSTVTSQNPCAEAGRLPEPADLPAQDVVGGFCVSSA